MDPSILVIAPILLPMFVAALCIFVRRNDVLRERMALGGMGLQFISAIALLAALEPGQFLVVKSGAWPVELGISLVADHFAALMVVLASLIGVVSMMFGYRKVHEHSSPFQETMTLVLMAGIAGAFLTGDIFNLFVWFEVLLMASFVLLGIGSGDWRREGTLKYVMLNLVASAVFLLGVGLIYAEFGTLSMALLSEKIAMVDQPPLALWLLFTAFGIKAGLFPCYLWLPGAYHAPHPMISTIFAALLTKVGVYALVRLINLIGDQFAGMFSEILLVAGLATMISGALGALAQNHLRRILSFHVISQVGFMVVAFGLGTQYALAAGVVYVTHHIVVKAALFIAVGLVAQREGSEDIKHLGGLATRAPILAALFLLAAMSLVGFPPMSGFLGKFHVLNEAVAQGRYWATGVCVIGGILTLLSMLKIWLAVFWGKRPEDEWEPQPASAPRIFHYVPLVVLVGISIALGVTGDVLWSFAETAAGEIVDSSVYINQVTEVTAASAADGAVLAPAEAVEVTHVK